MCGEQGGREGGRGGREVGERGREKGRGKGCQNGMKGSMGRQYRGQKERETFGRKEDLVSTRYSSLQPQTTVHVSHVRESYEYDGVHQGQETLT